MPRTELGPEMSANVSNYYLCTNEVENQAVTGLFGLKIKIRYPDSSAEGIFGLCKKEPVEEAGCMQCGFGGQTNLHLDLSSSLDKTRALEQTVEPLQVQLPRQ